VDTNPFISHLGYARERLTAYNQVRVARYYSYGTRSVAPDAGKLASETERRPTIVYAWLAVRHFCSADKPRGAALL